MLAAVLPSGLPELQPLGLGFGLVWRLLPGLESIHQMPQSTAALLDVVPNRVAKTHSKDALLQLGKLIRSAD